MTVNPEQRVLDDIDALIDQQLQHGPTDDYNKPWTQRCDICGWLWHGLPGDLENGGALGCPGAYATEQQREKWLQHFPAGQAIEATPYARCITVLEQIYQTLRDLRVLPDTQRCMQCQRNLDSSQVFHQPHTDNWWCTDCLTSYTRVHGRLPGEPEPPAALPAAPTPYSDQFRGWLYPVRRPTRTRG